MGQVLHLEPLTQEAFAPFGDVLEVAGDPDKIINQGLCGRYHDLANIDIVGGRAGISLFSAEPRQFPITLDMVERHPDGSQAFLPMSHHPFVVVVAPDDDGTPGQPRAFITTAGQGINFGRGTWHGVLTPIHAPGLFAVVDRIGSGPNLQEHWFNTPFTIQR
ncbi:ureidoglycolate lyase [Roseobacter sp. CCS2]|uniref:ureidoglycolate lyase n=1 Tax=Roseobacter sp. CCS2 TaxID=391593 RepID=UPI0000F3F75B|nr:ureidoglycolate lyase [Roseobacter sp. CCS2]EBA10607.1 ureidoglycolate hydrolase [Roseobacter sp. CCS2]